MPESLLITNAYLMTLIKKIEDLYNKKKVHEFFQPWPNFCKYYNKIFAYIL